MHWDQPPCSKEEGTLDTNIGPMIYECTADGKQQQGSFIYNQTGDHYGPQRTSQSLTLTYGNINLCLHGHHPSANEIH